MYGCEIAGQAAELITQEASLDARRAVWYAFINFALIIVLGGSLFAAGAGSAATVEGVVSDPTGAVVPGTTVEIQNPVSQFSRTATTDGEGKFSFTNVPPNNYHLTARAQGFVSHTDDIDVRTSVPLTLKITLQIGAATETVTVQSDAGDLVETDPTFHSDVDRQLFDRLPLESSSSEVSSLVTLATPGVS